MKRPNVLSTGMLNELSGEPMPAGNTAGASLARERLIPNRKSRLKEQFHEVCRFKHVSLRAEEAY
jgi:hypothetical protein